MSSGRFDSQKIVYLAGKKARERGRDKKATNSWRFDKLETLRSQMAECQVEFLASPENSPSILDGEEEKWNKLKKEYDQLMRAGSIEDSQECKGSNCSQNRSEQVSKAAIRAVRDHIHNAIDYAGSLSK